MLVVVFRAQRKEYQKDGDGGAHHNHEPVAEKEEIKHGVDLAEPDGRHDGEELYKDGSKLQEPRRSWGDLAGNLVRANRRCDGGLLSKPNLAAGKSPVLTF